MRVSMLWLSFSMLLVFWLAAFWFHLSGGLTTYSLLVVGVALLLKKSRANAR